jgi:hypothetical protein
MIEVIEYKGKTYPKSQTIGMTSQFAIPFAKHGLVVKINKI